MFLHIQIMTWVFGEGGAVKMGFTYLLIKPYPFLTLNHLTVPRTFVAATRHRHDTIEYKPFS